MVFVHAYSFTSALIAKALVDAHRRGVNIQVVLDRNQRTEKYSSATFVCNNGITQQLGQEAALAFHSSAGLENEQKQREQVLTKNTNRAPWLGRSTRRDPNHGLARKQQEDLSVGIRGTGNGGPAARLRQNPQPITP
jgi:hypothetical protein